MLNWEHCDVVLILSRWRAGEMQVISILPHENSFQDGPHYFILRAQGKTMVSCHHCYQMKTCYLHFSFFFLHLLQYVYITYCGCNSYSKQWTRLTVKPFKVAIGLCNVWSKIIMAFLCFYVLVFRQPAMSRTLHQNNYVVSVTHLGTAICIQRCS